MIDDYEDFARVQSQRNKFRDDEDRRAREAQAAQVNAATEDRSPDMAAKANVLGRQTGIPPRAIDAEYVKAYEASQRAKQVGATAEAHAPYAAFMSNPDNAAAAADDTTSLSALSQNLSAALANKRARDATAADRSWLASPNSNALSRGYKLLQRGLSSARAGVLRTTAELLAGTSDVVSSALGTKQYAPVLRDWARANEQIANTPIEGEQTFDKLPSISELVRKPVRMGEVFQFMFDSTAGSIPGTALAVAAPGLGFAANTGQIAQQRAAYDDRPDATLPDVLKAAPAGLLSTALDRFGFESIIGAEGKNALIRIGRAAGAEAATEFTQGVIESTGGSLGTKRGFDLSEALTAGTAGALGSVGMSLGVRVPQEIAHKTLDVAQGFKDAKQLDNVMSAAEASKLRARDPELFRQFVDQAAEGTPVENVYIPVEALETYQQSEGYEALPDTVQALVDAQIDEAKARQGSIVVPVGIASTELVGTKAWAALKDDARISPGGLSLRETREQATEVEAAVTEAGKEVDTEQADDGGKGELYSKVKAELLAQGLSPRQAEANAIVRAEQAAASGARIGMTAAEYEAFHKPVSVEVVDTPADAAVAKPGVFDQVTAEQARKLNMPTALPTDTTFSEAVANTNGAKITPEGLEMDLVRFQKPEQDGAYSVRTGVFYLPKGSPNAKHYKGGKNSYGGTETHAGPTLIRRPLFAKGGTGGKAPEAAFDAIRGKGAMKALEDRLYKIIQMRGHQREEAAAELLDEYDADSNMAYEIIANSAQGNQLRYALQENIIAHTVRNAGYDAVVGWSKGSKSGTFISEVFDVREQTYPSKYGDSEIHDAYYQAPDIAKPETLRRAANPTTEDIKTFYQAQTQTPAFKKWFGDSKVVDEAGEPLRMFHGTDASFDTFQKQIGQKASLFGAEPVQRHAFFFSANPRLADAIGDNRLEVYIKAENILDLSTGVFPDDVQKALVNKGYSERYLTNLHAEDMWALLDGEDGEQFVKDLKDLGFDAVQVYENMTNPDLSGPSLAVFDPTQIKSATGNNGDFDPNNPSILSQITDAPRGQIALSQDKIVISLFANANLSTLVHETGHLFLERMAVDAAHPNATPELKADWKQVKKWFKDQGHPITAGVISRDAHELFARGFERYAMEGKAPSASLQSVFASFRAWLLRIYAVVENLRSPITPELRGVFDRMLATQTEIDDMRAAQIHDTEVDAFMAKEMTAAEFVAYRALSASAQHEAYDQLLFKTMAKIRARETARYKESEKAVREDVQRAVFSEPRHVALHLLRTGKFLNDPARDAQPVKLDREWLQDTFGDDATERLPKGTIIWKDGGANADDIAAMTGFGSGKEMVEALFALQTEKAARVANGDTRPVRDAQIDEQVTATMDARGEPDPMTDGSIEEEAIAAVNNAKQGEVIATQIRQLARRTKASPTPYAVAREWAKRKIMAGKVSDVASKSAQQRYARAAAKASRAAEKAILDGDIDESFRQKQAQMLNHALLAEAKAAGDEVDVIVRRMNRLANRAAMQSVDQDYMDRIHAILEDYDFRPRSQALLAERESFAAWAAEQQAKGFEVHVPQRLLAAGEPYSRMAVDELIGLNDTVQSLLALGKHKQMMLDGQAERAFAEVRKDVLENLRTAPARKLPDSPINEASRTGMTQRRRSLRSAVASLLKVGTIALDLDNGNHNGPMMNLLVHRATEAENKRAVLRDQVLIPLSKLYLDLKGKAFSRLQEKVTIPELTWNALAEADPRLGQTVTMTRMELLAVALNTGNMSNLEKMSKGERWPVKTIQAVLDRELSASDWKLVQGMWDQVGSLWPEIVKVERELSGVVPEKVDALPITNKHGTFNGGYWPVVYDADRSQRAENNADKSADDMFGLMSGIGTPKGHTITRTNAVGPIRFSVEDVLLRHVEQVITRIAYAAYARDVIRTIEDPAIRGAIDTKLGSEYRRQIKPWLQRQISSYVDKRGTAWWEKVFRQARINTTVVGMGFRLSTGVAQISGLQASAARIGPMAVLKGMRNALGGVASAMAGKGNPQIEFMYERSEQMRRRVNESNREVDDVFRKLQGRHNIIDEAQQWAFWHIAMVDLHLVATPTWLGAHEKAINEGMTDYEASRYADQMVLTSQGGGRAKDMAAIQSPNSEAMKFFTMFYTPFNVMFNSQWEALRGIKRGEYTKAAQLTFFFFVAQVLSDAMLSGDWPEPDEDGDWVKGGLEWFGRNVFFGLFSGVPIARDAATYTERTITGQYATFGGTPITRIGEEVIRSGQNAKSVLWDGEEVDPKMLPGAANTVGLFTGLPLGQPGATGKFLWQYSRDEVKPTTFADFYAGLTKGKMPEKDDE